MVGFFNGLIFHKDFTRSVFVFLLIGLVLFAGFYSWAMSYPDPEPIDEPIGDDSPQGKLVFVPLTGKVVWFIIAFALLFEMILLAPIVWISGLIGSKTRTKYQSMKKGN